MKNVLSEPPTIAHATITIDRHFHLTGVRFVNCRLIALPGANKGKIIDNAFEECTFEGNWPPYFEPVALPGPQYEPEIQAMLRNITRTAKPTLWERFKRIWA